MLVLKGGVGVVIGGENGSWNGVRLPVFLPSMCLKNHLQRGYKRLCSHATSVLSCGYNHFVVSVQASCSISTSPFVVSVQAACTGVKPLYVLTRPIGDKCEILAS